mmetsp:Transcript_27/g.40  ORF Transcript_27/g.40 Transcript_27/m.40 type:complete len:1010 (-) Transcript_27:246-3275(-)|eukprot:CAMPEP_0172316514 /NCGR_PEP_ID=MMETSP1058-20130122/28497_1 /TAXON_ID=83371 /ORGANISM="Detonula confervacea, Strain CCMP 353" /LENGTH=1009 /DNA_ID=CAMNT_0013030835 /DNA_START=69 /DNA_END=3098 /DNA_ORIENTATION=+
MGLLRAIFRIGQQADDDGVVPDDRPIYPPEDKLTFEFEEVFVTLAVLLISYMILATPCFSIRRRARLGTRLNAGGWMEAVKQFRHVRNVEDVKNWRKQLLQGDIRNHRNVDPQRWDEFMRSRQLNDIHDMEKTVRTKGGGRSVPTTPLRSFFRPANTKMHASTSEGYLAGSLVKVKQPLPAKQSAGAPGGEEGESFYKEDFRPETDHDRFEKAWKSQIRFAEYRRLVLPPECKLVEFTSHWREVEQSLLENLLDESRWNKIISYVRNVFDVLYGIYTWLFSKEITRQFSAWMMEVFRYRMRKQRGMSVEEDEMTVDDDDDGSVTTLPSSAGKGYIKTPTNPELLPAATPVVSNRRNLSQHIRMDGEVSPLDYVPQLVSHSSPKPVDDGNSSTHKKNGHGNENDPSFMNVPQSANSEQRDGHAEKMSVRPRFSTADFYDDATLHSCNSRSASHTDSSEKNSRSFDIPSSVGQSPKKMFNMSPLPMKYFHKQKKKDALESYRRPDITPIHLPHLHSASEPDPPLEKVSPVPSLMLNPRNPDTAPIDSSNMNFFDTANSDRQLRDMSRAVPIPDANGYILGDEFLGSSYTPLLVFVNSRSGPQQGHLLITQFRRLLNPIQVWDLAKGGPEKILKSFSVLSHFQILVCGGDGTVSWIISALERMDLKHWPPIGILPLGTGNDLARIHGWGGGYNNESLLFILRQISESYISMLDLWELDITSTNKKGKQRKEVKSFINYLGVGVDAQAALQVHNLRESKPNLFISRFFNKAWYAIAGGEEAIKSSCANLSQQITLMADGIEIPLPPDSQGIIFLNIDSYSGGVPMWSKGKGPKPRVRVRRYSEGDFMHANGNGLTRNDSIEDLAELEQSRELTACDLPSSCQDGLLDVVSIRGAFHLGQIRVGLGNPQLLCQCRAATVTLKKKVAVQIDGEPWRQNPSTLKIIRKPDRATMLNRSAEDSGGVESEVTKLLNWASEREFIDRKQYALLMEEFSRRIEHKKRTQKEKGNGFSFVG